MPGSIIPAPLNAGPSAQRLPFSRKLREQEVQVWITVARIGGGNVLLARL
jgi:hypothetical protein